MLDERAEENELKALRATMTRTSGNSRLARNAAVVAAALALWSGLVLLFATPLALTSAISWREAVRFGASFWALWLLFLPGVAWLSFRFPIARRSLLRNLALHLAICVLIVVGSKATSREITRFSLAPQNYERPGRPPVRLGPPGSFAVFLALRAALDVLVYWSLVGVCHAIIIFRGAQERERRAAELESRLASAQLQALRMQMNPHFLFNTLNSTAALVYVNPRAADEMLGDLSALLRRSLDSMDEHEIPLAEELEFIGTYLNIEQKRFGERLRLEQSVPDELMNALVPALILQPIVENAIRHGIEPRRGPGLISITAQRAGGRLRLMVTDNGRGLPESGQDRSAGCGIGLANIRARLQALYGQRQSFAIGQAEPQGCQVDISIPLHFQPAQVAANPQNSMA